MVVVYLVMEHDWHGKCQVCANACAGSISDWVTHHAKYSFADWEQADAYTYSYVSAGREKLQRASAAVAVPVRAGAQPSACEVRRRCPRRGRERPADGCDQHPQRQQKRQQQEQQRQQPQQPQANAYDALVRVFSSQPSWDGVFWWSGGPTLR